MQVSIRFLIGLDSPSDAGFGEAHKQALATKRRRDAEHYLSGAYSVGGLYSGTGFWQGKAEPCLQFETIQEDKPEARESARAHARNLRDMLDQDAIGLVFAPVELELI